MSGSARMEVFYSVLSLVIGAGMFLVGIVMFSESLEKYASRGKSALFKKISDNHFAGFGIGTIVTALAQSSAATTVTAVGLVNAGILTVLQASSIMLGAHFGTCSTIFIVSLSTFNIKYLFMTLGFVGALMKILTSKGRIIRIANLLIGFGVLFVGLNLMSAALKDSTDLREFFISLFKKIEFPPLLILLGIVFTIIVQSSTASISLFLMMLVEGLLSFENAMFLSMGAFIGTCFTPIFAAITANTNAKRAALINLLFSVIGVSVFTCLIWPLKSFAIPAYEAMVQPAWQIPVFQLSYNLIAGIVLIWFLEPLGRLASRLLKDKPETKEVLHTTYIDDRLLTAPSIAVDQTKKEIRDMMDRARENLNLAFNALVNRDFSNKKKIKKEEDLIDFLNRAIAMFIVKLSGNSLSESEDIMLVSFCRVINDIERVGDYACKILKDAGRMKKKKYKFHKKDITRLEEMFSKVQELFNLCIEIFESRDLEKLENVSGLEGEIGAIKSNLALGHLMWLKAGQYIMAGGEYFYSAISDLERVSNHLINVALSVSPYLSEQIEDNVEDPQTADESES